MTEFQFELKPFFRKTEHGRQGVVGAFGEVTVEAERKKRSIRTASRQLEVRLHGEQMPEVVYRTVGPGRPTLKNAVLAVDGHSVQLEFNSKAIRNTSRALKLSYQERLYEYIVTGFDKGAALRRPGVLISLTRGKNTAGKGMSTFGTVSGEADAVDLALAVIFEEVDTQELTTSGAASEAVNRLLNPRANETPAD
ncbi:hypothetical protein [Streptomyces sp. MZ04]|uniref:hypothetical protein n=1 Tax=Streptomyces sp. MZ04 TaxID=2559236 RepID=UPI00107EE695|nr:hypothetical protein [Streptomyces sp. MZ04]TGB06024.1 hypothetical protein E2651_23940 [Streptomyces sp. MZ04]